jgi:hypothetical protein
MEIKILLLSVDTISILFDSCGLRLAFEATSIRKGNLNWLSPCILTLSPEDHEKKLGCESLSAASMRVGSKELRELKMCGRGGEGLNFLLGGGGVCGGEVWVCGGSLLRE